MSSEATKTSIPVRVGIGAVAWGLVLLLAWAIHPVDAVASVGPVENPSAAQQASIDRVLGDADDPQPELIERFQCDSTPLQAATGADGASAAPTLEDGFEYLEAPCSSEYGAARAAFWVNVFVLACIVAGSVVMDVRRRGRSSDGAGSTDTAKAEAQLVD